jgi:hypothetical protein
MKNIGLRLPDELHKGLKQTAKINLRSLNSEIARAIEYYLKNAPEAHYETGSKQADEKIEAKKKPK